MLILANYAYHRPTDLKEAVRLLQEEGSLVIAGGSDVLPQLKNAVIEPKALVDLGKIPELRTVTETEDGVRIGAMAVLSSLAEDPVIRRCVPAVGKAARNTASPQIRNRGTIGGNLLQARRCFYYNQTEQWREGIPRCFKVGGGECLQIPNSPVCRAIYYSDLAPVMLAYGASAEVLIPEDPANGPDPGAEAGRTGSGTDAGSGAVRFTERTMSCEELISLHTADRLPKLLVRAFVIPKENYEGTRASFAKYSLRGSIDFPMINFACVAGNGKVCLRAGAIAPQVLELTDAEAYLAEAGSGFDLETAVETAVAEMKAKCLLIRESGISVPVKRNAFSFVRETLEALQKMMR